MCGSELTDYTGVFSFLQSSKVEFCIDVLNEDLFPVISLLFEEARCLCTVWSSDGISQRSFMDITVHNPVGVRKNSPCAEGPQLLIHH